jgi:ElaB/YqjD/DUF883 family membrane-anchored ribosome-binding protein
MEARLSSPGHETRTLPTERLADDFKLLIQSAEEKARERARAADRVVRERPYQTIGVVLGLGVLIGALARHWWGGRG